MKTFIKLAKEIQIIAEEMKNMKPKIGEMWSAKLWIFAMKMVRIIKNLLIKHAKEIVKDKIKIKGCKNDNGDFMFINRAGS